MQQKMKQARGEDAMDGSEARNQFEEEERALYAPLDSALAMLAGVWI